MSRFRRIKTQVSLFYIGISFIVLAIFISMIYYNISNIFIREGITKTVAAIENSREVIHIYIDKIKGIAKIIGGDQNVLSFLRDSNSNDTAIQSMFDTIMDTDSHIKNITIVSYDGRSSGTGVFQMPLSDNMMKEEWYQEAIRNHMTVFKGVRKETSYSDEQEWVISLSREIKDESGKNLGVLLMNIEHSVIGECLEGVDLGRDGYVYMINTEEELIYHKNTDYYTDEDKKAELLETYQKGFNYDKRERRLVYNTRIENADWILIGVLSLDGIRMLEEQLYYMITFIGIFTFIVVLISGTFLASKIGTPLHHIENAMSEIEKLNEISVCEKGFYEITLLEKNYNKMIRRIKELMTELSMKEGELRKMEVSTLISQINPHFLYNTLDTICWMAEMGEGEKVVDMTKSLAVFFRLSLNRGKEFVTIREEISHVKEYLYIQKIRYGEKLEYEIQAEESLLDIIIPKIIFQPLVENSIYHGIKPKDGKGFIKIIVERKNAAIHLIVEDDGIGIKERDGKMREEASIIPKLGGIGIANVDKRIKLYYGSEYGVSLESRPGGGCRAIVKIGKLPANHIHQ